MRAATNIHGDYFLNVYMSPVQIAATELAASAQGRLQGVGTLDESLIAGALAAR